MKYDPDRHHRRSIRLKDYNYSQEGAYFVTICTHKRECLFGEIRDGEMQSNDIGVAVHNEWMKSALIRREIHLDMFVVMPNHIHGLVFIVGDDPALVGATGGRPFFGKQTADGGSREFEGDRRSPLQTRGPRRRSLAAFIGGFKSACTRSVNEFGCTSGIPLWQRNYYEHVIRNENSLNALREYIQANPSQWAIDPDNLDCSRQEGLSNDP
jgi:putative transposase